MTFDDFSFLMINTMISLSVPGIAQLILQVLVNFVYLDLLMMERWFPAVLQWVNGNNDNFSNGDAPLNSFFDDNGLGSKLFLNNIGSAIIYLLIYVSLFLLSWTL